MLTRALDDGTQVSSFIIPLQDMDNYITLYEYAEMVCAPTL